MTNHATLPGPSAPRCPPCLFDTPVAVATSTSPSETFSRPPCNRSRRRTIASLRHGARLVGQAAIADAAAGETGRRRGGGRQFQAQSRTRLGADNPLARGRGSLRPHPTVVRAEGRSSTSAAAAKIAVGGRR